MSTQTINRPTDRMGTKHAAGDRALDGMRKAAILVSALDRDTVDMLLDQMDPAQASLVRQAVIELDDIDPTEQQQVIEEFFRLGPGLPEKRLASVELDGIELASVELDGVELDGRLAQSLSQTPGDGNSQEENSTVISPFEFLNETDSERVATVLLSERPQTTALVLSHMPPDRAGQVLVRLPAAMQAEVVRRLVDLEETDPEILHEVEQELQKRLSRKIHMERRRVAGIPAVANILEASDSRVGATILSNLAARDKRLAQRFASGGWDTKHLAARNCTDKRSPQSPRPIRLDFTDLAALDAETLSSITENVEPEILVLALLGASSPLIDRVLRQMPQSRAVAIRHELENIGPVRLSDVEEARRRLLATAERLHATGRIRLAVAYRESSIGLTA